MLKNLTIKGNVEGEMWSGGLASFAHGAIISNVVNEANITNTKNTNGDNDAGGLVGRISMDAKVTFINCVNKGVIASMKNAGGVAGFARRGSTVVFDNCKNLASVTSETQNVGGIVGFLLINTQILNCMNYGSITSPVRPGGIAGRINNNNSTSVIKNCMNMGSVICTRASLFSQSSAFGSSTENATVDGVISLGTLNGNENLTYYGSDFSDFYISWKYGSIGLKTFGAMGTFQSTLTSQTLKNKGYTKIA